MPRFPKKAKGATPPVTAPVGPDAILEAVEDTLERGEKKLRDREPAKAQKLFREALGQVQAAHLSNHPHGSVLLSSLTGSLLTIDSEDARLASWARRGGGQPEASLTPEQRFGALQAAAAALEAGQATAEVAGVLVRTYDDVCPPQVSNCGLGVAHKYSTGKKGVDVPASLPRMAAARIQHVQFALQR